MPKPAYAALPPSSSGLSLASASGSGFSLGQPGPRHWSVFWREFGEGEALPERCHVPGDGQMTVDRHWAQFAERLPRGAQVLDIGCGAGTVGRTLLGCRPDLTVTGIDFAEVPVDEFPNLAIHPRVSMEALPFGESCFDAAVSLFGIEYGVIADTALQLARVLKPDGRFGFVVHHCESEIAHEGRTRVRGIQDVMTGRVRAAFLAGDTERFDQQRLRLQQDHPQEPTVKLVSDYFRRNIERPRAGRLEIWTKLANDVAVEVALTSQMTRSAKSAAELGSWIAPLLAVMTRVNLSVVRRGSGEPIGWAVGGVR